MSKMVPAVNNKESDFYHRRLFVHQICEKDLDGIHD